MQESSWSPTSSSSAHSSGLSADGGGGGSSSAGNTWADGSSDIHTIHTFVRKARANKGKNIRRHSDSTLLDKMRLKDSLYENQASSKAERKKDKKLKKLSLGSAVTADSGSSEGEKRARIKRSKNSKQPKAKKLKSSVAQSEMDTEGQHTHAEVQPIREELAVHRTSTTSVQGLGKVQPDESIREADMSSSEGETWIADEDIMVESGVFTFRT